MLPRLAGSEDQLADTLAAAFDRRADLPPMGARARDAVLARAPRNPLVRLGEW